MEKRLKSTLHSPEFHIPFESAVQVVENARAPLTHQAKKESTIITFFVVQLAATMMQVVRRRRRT